VVVAERHRVARDVILDRVQQKCGVDLRHLKSDEEIITAISVLDDLRLAGLGDPLGKN
jgi:hypothetical protein